MIFELTLDNGLKAIVKENHRVPLIILQAFVRTGAIHEGEHLGTGISHLLEHIIYKGPTLNRSEEEVISVLELLGNSANAYTTNDHTSYYIIVSKEHFDVALDLIVDCLMNSLIQEGRFQRELGVVQREIEQDEDNPDKALWQLFVENMYRVHPIKFPVIGYKNRVKSLTPEEVDAYYKKKYIPNNMIFTVAGDINAEDVLQKVKSVFDAFERKNELSYHLPDEPPQLNKRIVVKEMNIKAARMAIGYRTVPLFDSYKYPLDLLSSILGAGRNSLLSKLNKTQEGHITSITSSSFTPHFVSGYFAISATMKTDFLDEAREKILKILFRLKTAPVKDEDLRRGKNQKISQYLFNNQTLRDEALELGNNALANLNSCFIDDYVSKIESVRTFQIQKAAERFFCDDQLTVAIIVPHSKSNENDERNY